MTSDELAARVMSRLGLVAPNEIGDPADLALVNETLQADYEKLRKLRLAPFSLTDIPDWAADPLKRIVAGTAAIDFGFTGQDLAEFMADRRLARGELQEQIQSEAPPIPTRTDYF